MTDTDRVGKFGTIYVPALQRIHNLWIRLEPLVVDSGYDDPVEPTELWINLPGGLVDATSARLDIQWSELNNYSFHYVDSAEVNWRFDPYPKTHSPTRHFHPPPDAATADAQPSCGTIDEVSLVTRAVHKLWRSAYESRARERPNSISNPP